jgi:uncharacterized protein (DUF305 family)
MWARHMLLAWSEELPMKSRMTSAFLIGPIALALAAGVLAPSPVTADDEVPFDLVFLDTMSKHHHDGIHLARMAESKIQRHDLQHLVRKMLADQQTELERMQGWRSRWFHDAPRALRPLPLMDLQRLEHTPAGAQFDAVFLDMMIPHHEAAIALAQEATTRASHRRLRSLAHAIVHNQQHEVEQMREWQRHDREHERHDRRGHDRHDRREPFRR